MADLKAVYAHSPSVVARKTGNEYILVPVANNIADMTSVYTLNETGAFIWEQIDGVKSLEDIAEALVSEFETDRETAETDLADFMEDVKRYLVIK